MCGRAPWLGQLPHWRPTPLIPRPHAALRLLEGAAPGPGTSAVKTARDPVSTPPVPAPRPGGPCPRTQAGVEAGGPCPHTQAGVETGGPCPRTQAGVEANSMVLGILSTNLRTNLGTNILINHRLVNEAHCHLWTLSLEIVWLKKGSPYHFSYRSNNKQRNCLDL